jgi:uncharacterized protein
MAKCPICGRTSAPGPANKALPFCSVRCKQVDLGNWLDGRYLVPGSDHASEDDEAHRPESTPGGSRAPDAPAGHSAKDRS